MTDPLLDAMAHTLMVDYGLDPMQDMKFDPHYTDYPYYRYFCFANWRDRTNILIKFDETALV